ncbi:uncharacterized protein [Magallana gigas]|uniref:uncharacterized protein n=1 Tax=Magallana gigas TaxID=29159 RepID=UPI00333EAA1D
MEIKEKYLLIILALSVVIKTESSMELKSYTACYGILGNPNFLLASCPAGQKIAVMAVYTLAKYKSTGCPQIQTSSGDDPACCQYDVTDCSYLYDSGSFRAYYQACNGKAYCQIQVSWIDIPSHCNSSVYIERTHYMKMDYYCISDQAVDPCTDLTTSDSPAFFWNTGYPAEMTATSSSCTCSIEMSCDTTVELTAIDLQLKDPGNCKQSLVVTDGSFSSIYDCSSNNDFLPRVMYTSTSHFVTIVFTNNLGITGGKFFIRIQGTNPTGEVTLSCGASTLTMSSQNPSSLPTCPIEGGTTTNIPTASISTEDPTTLTSLTTDSSNVSSSTQDELTTTSSDSSTTSDVNTTSLFSTDMTTQINVTVDNITSDVTQEMTTLMWMSTENISTIADMESCCSDSNASDGLPVYVIPVIVLGVLLVLAALGFYHRNKIMTRCRGKDHSKFQSLPPLRHEFTMAGRNLDTPTPITREHKRFQTAKKRHDNKSLVKFSEEKFNADTDPITEISASYDRHGLQESSKEGKKLKKKKNKSNKRNSKNKVSQQEDVQEDGGATSQL